MNANSTVTQFFTQFVFTFLFYSFCLDTRSESTTPIVSTTASVSSFRRNVRRRLDTSVNIEISSDDTWMYADTCLDDLLLKYEYRVKALNMEKKRRMLLAEKIVLEAVNIYCAKAVKTTLYDDSQDYE